jgi:ligand-binding sensor domain-containing protein
MDINKKKISRRFSYIFIFFLLIFLYNLYPQTNSVRFETLSLQNGVSLNLTNALLQDSKGYIWFGTMYGLVKYDGKDYTIYHYLKILKEIFGRAHGEVG